MKTRKLILYGSLLLLLVSSTTITQAQIACNNEGQGQCNDHNPCTDDTCVEIVCVNTPIAGCCNTVVDCGLPTNACQEYECVRNNCTLTNIQGCCTQDIQCDDNNPCTTDKCLSNTCAHSNVTNCCVADVDCLDAHEICFDDFCNKAINQCYKVSNRSCCDSDNNCQAFANICQVGRCLTNNTCAFDQIPGCCLSDSDCPSSGPCNTGTYNLTTSKCESNPVQGCCSNDSDCASLAGTCQIGTCNLSASQCIITNVSNCCTSDSQCDDGEYCTLDFCDNTTKQCKNIYQQECCSYNFTCPNPNVCTIGNCNMTVHKCYNTSTSPLCDPTTDVIFTIADCLLNVTNGTILGRFVYNNLFWTTINIPAGGPDNYFTPTPLNLGQPSSFPPGSGLFYVPIIANDLQWTLTSPDGSTHRANMNTSITPFCGTYCNTDSDCSFYDNSCMRGHCDNNVCVCNAIQCPVENACVLESFCEVNVNDCVSVPYSCDDDNPCTVDSCHVVNGDPSCMHVLMQDCVPPQLQNGTCPNCNHTVSLTINDCAYLNISQTSPGEWEICHTSLNRGALSANVIDFYPYVNCSISDQGTCSNHYSYPSADDSHCIYPSYGTNNSCGVQHSGVAMTIPGISNNLFWENSIVQITLDLDNTYNAQVIGNMYDPSNSSLKFQVRLVFNQYTPGLPGIRSFLSTCYTDHGGFLDVSQWQFFINTYGTIVAQFGTPYYGLKLSVQSYSYTQLGFGANNVNTNYGLFGQFFYTIISQPFNNQYSVQSPPNNTYGSIWMDVTAGSCTINTSYCAEYQEPQLVPANGWSVFYNTSYIQYCRTFTIDEILSCRMYDDLSAPLFNLTSNTSSVSTYMGNIYATTLLPVNCFIDINTSQCFEEQLQRIMYPINLTVATGGVLSISYTVSDISVSVHPVYNIWLIGDDLGDLEVIFRTCVEEQPTDSEFVMLGGGSVLHNQATTPVQFYFVDSNVECDSNSPFPYCCQTWGIRTYGAGAVSVYNFSGFIPIQFDALVDGVCREDITVYINLEAANRGNGNQLNGTLCSRLLLFRDRYFQKRYISDPRHPLVECDPLYGVLGFCEEDDNYDIEIRKAAVCYLANGDITPFNPLSPSNTGCNTPGAFRRLLFSEDVLDAPFIDPTAKFMFLSNPPAGQDKEAFVFTVRPYTTFNQLLQIDWYAIDTSSGNVLVEQITEYELDDGNVFLDRSEIDEEFEDFYVRKCVFSDPKDKCKERDIDIILQFDDDDDDSDCEEDEDRDHHHNHRHHRRHARRDLDELKDHIKHKIDEDSHHDSHRDRSHIRDIDDDEVVVITKHHINEADEDDDGPSPAVFVVISIVVLILILMLLSLCYFLDFLPSRWFKPHKKSPARSVFISEEEQSSYSNRGLTHRRSSSAVSTTSDTTFLIPPHLMDGIDTIS